MDLVSHETSICCRRIETVPETQSTHGSTHDRPGRAIVLNFPKRSTIFTEPDEVVRQQKHDMLSDSRGSVAVRI